MLASIGVVDAKGSVCACRSASCPNDIIGPCWGIWAGDVVPAPADCLCGPMDVSVGGGVTICIAEPDAGCPEAG